MRKKRRELHRWHHLKEGTFRVVHLPAGVVVDFQITQAHEPFVSTLRGLGRTVFDTGYRWVYFTPGSEHHALIVALNGQGVPVQLYVDICEGHGLDDDGLPFIVDMFLDVLAWIEVQPGGEWRLGEPEIIDQDELDEALALGEITPAQHANAWTEARRVEGMLQRNAFPALDVVRHYLRDPYT